jgi:hypothetical protein
MPQAWNQMLQHFGLNKNSNLPTINKVPTTKEIAQEVKAFSEEIQTTGCLCKPKG